MAYSAAKQIATWSRARDVWEEAGASLLCEHLDVFSGTWPTCGMTRAGTAYALPTWAHRMADIGSSSTPTLPTLRATRGGSSTETVALLPTPTANVGANGGAQHPDKRRSVGHSVSIQDVAEFKLLPTARASNGMGGLLRPHASDATRLEDAVGVFLLPTPRATDGTKGGPGQRGSSGDLMLPSAVHLLPTPTASPYGSLWGQYAPVIERWARTIHRKPPPPTEPSKKGGHRLSPKFVEWMQGLPAGHVTNVPGISNNNQLKALGNGVVPQQVAAATRAFLADTGWSL